MSIENITQLISGESRFRSVFHKIIICCESPKTLDMLEDVIKMDKNELVGIPILLEWLEEAGALSFEQGKEAAEAVWTSTESGLEYVRANSPDNRITKLFNEESGSVDIMKELLRFCKTPRTLGELETAFGTRAQEAGLSVSFYISALENAGAVRWDNGWVTETEGEKYM